MKAEMKATPSKLRRSENPLTKKFTEDRRSRRAEPAAPKKRPRLRARPRVAADR